jgi:hypothetical protein
MRRYVYYHLLSGFEFRGSIHHNKRRTWRSMGSRSTHTLPVSLKHLWVRFLCQHRTMLDATPTVQAIKESAIGAPVQAVCRFL